MFCSKCGAQLPDDARFCNVCGQQLGAPAGASAAKKPIIPFKLPTLSEKIMLFYSLVVFVLSFQSVIGASFVAASLFDYSAILGIAKIFFILNIFVFIFYVFLHYFDINRLFPNLSTAPLRKLMGIVYYGVYLFCLLFALIAVLDDVGILSAMWFIMLFAAVGGLISAIIPDFTRKIFGD